MNSTNPNHVIITGEVGIGKTAVCIKLVDQCRIDGIPISGILTIKTDRNHRITEDIQTGDRKVLAVLDVKSERISESRYTFLEEGIRFANSVIRKSGEGSIVLIDEIGPLELNGKGFTASDELLDSKSSVQCILVIRKSILPAFLKKHSQKFTIIEVTLDNRSNIHNTIFESIKKKT